MNHQPCTSQCHVEVESQLRQTPQKTPVMCLTQVKEPRGGHVTTYTVRQTQELLDKKTPVMCLAEVTEPSRGEVKQTL